MSTVPQSQKGGAGHKRKDADVVSIFLIGVAVLLFVVLVLLIIWMTLRHLRVERSKKEGSTKRVVEKAETFPRPRLQVDPAEDLAQMRARDLLELTTYGWIDRKAGIARIPIERAMQLLAERGLPNVGANQTPLSLMQGAKKTPARRRSRY
jgi:hypothetical protein